MRVLFATGSPAQYMAPPVLGDEQINCGPDWPDAKDGSGRWLSFRTPVGAYDLGKLALRLPPDEWPDLVVCLVDASWRNRPSGLAAFGCPRILLVADTHHMQRPLLGMLQYATSEPFTRTVLLYDRHHEAVFRSAGVKQLYWFPGLTFPHADSVVRDARVVATQRTARIRFVGQAGTIHPRRARLLGQLQSDRLPVEQVPARQAGAIKAYGSASVGFNASLNGDLNLRVFEILASGAALLTDRLSSASGLATMLGEGREMLGYSSADELVEQAHWLMANQERATAIGSSGAQWFDTHFCETKRRANFASVAFDGHAPAMFQLGGGGRHMFSGETDRLVRATVVYEGLQELHRVQERVRIVLSPSVSPDVIELFSTLPRVDCLREASATPADLSVMSCADPVLTSEANRIWCWDAMPDDPAYARRMAAHGYVCLQPKLGLFAKSSVVATASVGSG